jgi:NADPH:quinone reductase-like Zn-dependent oxidoreductase
MRAVRVHQFGGPEVMSYEEMPVPQPGAGEVLVRIRAAGVGPWDALVRSGQSGLPQPLPLTLGSDVAGVVESVGAGVSAFRPGDAVFGVTNSRFTDGYAELAAVRAASIALKPLKLDFVAAAGVPVVAVTAWEMLFKYAAVKSGQLILINGASGSVGEFAVQLAKLQGARIVASVSFGDKEYIRSLGADEIVDLRAGAVGGPFDVIIDTVGGEIQARSVGFLRRGGILVSVVSPPDDSALARQGARGAFFIVDVTRQSLQNIARLVDSGSLRAHVGSVLPLAEARKAHEMLAGAVLRPPGKIILTPA